MPASSKRLSIIIPVFNEAETIVQVLEQIARLALKDAEVIVVDDGSSDGTRDAIRSYQQGAPSDELICIFLQKNQGKSKAIQAALQRASGDYTVIQDADLEYDPSDLPRLLRFGEKQKRDAVYGSRFHPKKFPENMGIMHYLANRGITFLTNLLYGARLTDQNTCYKLIKTDLLRRLHLSGTGFEFCAEVTAKLRRRGVSISEIPIHYRARDKTQGKKIKWFHVFPILKTLLVERFRGTTSR